jgi:hypothetical protein
MRLELLSILLRAIAIVESDNGITSDNVYQITPIYVQDVNRIAGTSFTMSDALDRSASEEMMLTYWEHYGKRYERLTGKKVTMEVLARIHNGGLNGYKKSATDKYWCKIKKALERIYDEEGY